MGVSKITYYGDTLIDLTSDTVTESSLLDGITCHDKSGNKITGNVTFITVRSGTSAPSNSIGNDGDIYFVEKV